MSLSKSRLFVSGFAFAGLAGAVALGYAAPQLGKAVLFSGGDQAIARTAPADTALVRVAEKQKDGVRVDVPSAQVDAGRNVRVDAPHTAVNVDKESGRVRVKAPHTDVKVDPDRGQVRVRAPYVNLDIRW